MSISPQRLQVSASCRGRCSAWMTMAPRQEAGAATAAAAAAAAAVLAAAAPCSAQEHGPPRSSCLPHFWCLQSHPERLPSMSPRRGRAVLAAALLLVACGARAVAAAADPAREIFFAVAKDNCTSTCQAVGMEPVAASPTGPALCSFRGPGATAGWLGCSTWRGRGWRAPTCPPPRPMLPTCRHWHASGAAERHRCVQGGGRRPQGHPDVLSS